MELILYSNLMKNAAVCALESGDTAAAMRDIAVFAETQGISGDAVREYMVTALADDDNILSRMAQSGREIGNDLYSYALRDIKAVQAILERGYPSYCPSAPFGGFYDGYAQSVQRLMRAEDAKQLLDSLILHYRTLGSGIFAKYIAFRCGEGGISGIGDVDTVSFDDLVGIAYQKQVLIDNTTAFLRGQQANNVLLFGDRGSGKSSSVKALLNQYYRDGLRMIEVPKYHIREIPALSAQLSRKPHRYILFLDDLSFETHETDYRALKVAMEGQLQANPENVLIYATSNRRHLIKETWADREGGEVHINDNMQETLSLSERFGISLVFSAPSNQKEYLAIVRQLLQSKGIESTPEIEQQAVVWQMNYGSRSGRCANQFAAAYAAKAKQMEEKI